MNRLCKYLPRPVLVFLMLQHTESQALTLSFVFEGVPIANPDKHTDYCNCFLWSSTVPAAKCWYGASSWVVRDLFFLHLYQFIIHYHPLIQLCIVRVTDSIIK